MLFCDFWNVLFLFRYHLLAGQIRGEVLGNSFYGGKCTLIKSNDTRKTYRVPINVESVSFQVNTTRA